MPLRNFKNYKNHGIFLSFFNSWTLWWNAIKAIIFKKKKKKKKTISYIMAYFS